MALHSANTGLLMNGINMAQYFFRFDMEASQAVHDKTVLGNSAVQKTVGLKTGKADGEGFLDETSTIGSFDFLKGRYSGATPGNGVPATVTRCLNSSTFAVGSKVDLGYFHEASLRFNIAVADLEKVTFNGEPDQDAIDYGVSLQPLSAVSSFPSNGTAVDNAASSANGGVGVVHCTAIAGASPRLQVTIEHSTDNSTWITLVTFTNITAANASERVEVAAGTTVRRYLRRVLTDQDVTSSVTLNVSFARR